MSIFWLVAAALLGISTNASVDKLRSGEDISLQDMGYHMGSLVGDINEDKELKKHKMIRLDELELRSKNLYNDLVSGPESHPVELSVHLPQSAPETSSEELLARLDSSLRSDREPSARELDFLLPKSEKSRGDKEPSARELDFLLPKSEKSRADFDPSARELDFLLPKSEKSRADLDPSARELDFLLPKSEKSRADIEHNALEFDFKKPRLDKPGAKALDILKTKSDLDTKTKVRNVLNSIKSEMELVNPRKELPEGIKGVPGAIATDSGTNYESMKLDPNIDDCQRKYNQLYRMYRELGFKYLDVTERASRKQDSVKGFSPLVLDGDDGKLVGGGYLIVPDQKLLLFGPPSDVFRRPTAQELAIYRDIKDNNQMFANINGRLLDIPPVQQDVSPILVSGGSPYVVRSPLVQPTIPRFYPPKSSLLEWRSLY